MRYFAHTLPGVTDTTRWEPLEDHLTDVASLAEQFAEPLGVPSWGRLVGLWHDLGKYSTEFQDYLKSAGGAEAHIEQKQGRVDHSTCGAQLAAKRFPGLGQLLAYVMAGHHAGLADAHGSESSLAGRLAKTNIPEIHAVPPFIDEAGIEGGLPGFLQGDKSQVWFRLGFLTRMLFSCLCDADFLATERFMSPDRAGDRPGGERSLEQMRDALDSHLDNLTRNAPEGTVNDCRRQVLTDCRSAAERSPGLFSLTVPTGGGKTLASLSFALRHAVQHGRRRVIVAIPFTSIIEQTAAVYRGVFDDRLVLEHHSAIDPDREDSRSRLAAENWDAPLVVTTNVQLFESLFAARTSRCRKLHRLANSVILLDEVQTLPVHLLRPTLAVIDELTRNYGCTIVLCTATQPELHQREGFEIGLTDVREIIGEPVPLYDRMRRVTVSRLGSIDDEALVERMLAERSFLTIVNTRRHASTLFQMLSDRKTAGEEVFHLSTLMCARHRSEVIQTIKQRLVDKLPTRVVSTQLIEAGVDLDFPVVFRALTGLDSVAQAAGRCNREGELDSGTLYLFEPTDVTLRGYLRTVAESTREVLQPADDPLDPDVMRRYFAQHLSHTTVKGENRWDDRSVMDCFTGTGMPVLNFRTAAERYRWIDETGVPIFVQYGDGAKRLIEQLRREGPHRKLFRKLQTYTVTLYDQIFRKLRDAGDIEMAWEGEFPFLSNPSAYDDDLGVRIDQPGFIEPDVMVL